MVHCRFSYDPARPWTGLSPLQWANVSASLGASLERRLSEEASGPVGHIIALPQDPGKSGADERADDDPDTPQPLDMLRADMGAARGKTLLLETVMGGWGDAQAEPKRDYTPTRYGADPPETLAALRSDTGKAIIAACGLSTPLFDASDGTAKREAFRTGDHARL